ncbi:MAG: DUF1802 family protein [Dehalococcoidia bacterium]|jgi:hypothetical protein|nr:DUF1802 family protein [Dehalococcoidia bacterium]
MTNACQTAFKEWAVTIDALARGEQIVILRKGGIHERNLHFQMEHDRFLFFPGYLHQDPELLKPEYRSRLTLEPDAPRPSEHQPVSSEVTFSVYAEVTDVVELESPESVIPGLEPFHIWAPGFALKRAHWKPLHPLNAVLMRCFSIEKPVTMPVLPEYSGCTSWVDLDSEVPLGEMTPALSDVDYAAQVSEIKAVLAPTRATA